MILISTGNGKGKTTAALGQAIRVIGQGKRVAFLQFIKSKKWPTGEEKALQCFKKKLKFIKGGKGFVGILGDRLPREVHQKATEKLFTKAKKIILSGKYSLVVLDEINVALSLKLLRTKEVAALLANVPSSTDVMLTGRGVPVALVKLADLVTECREIKHPYQKGTQGKRGREY